MKVAKIALIAVFLLLIVVIGYMFTRDTNTASNRQSQSDFTQLAQGKRGDDPVYAEEIRKNTALTIQTRDHQKALEQQIKSTIAVIKEEGRRQKAEAQKRVRELEQTIRELKASAAVDNSDEVADKVKSAFDEKLAQIADTVSSLSQSIDDNTTNTNNAIAQIRQEYQQAASVPTDTPAPISVETKPEVKEAVTYPYGFNQSSGSTSQKGANAQGEDTSVIDYLQSKFNNAAAVASDRVTGSQSKPNQSQQTNQLPTASRTKEEEWETVFPVYTLPPNTVLSNSTLITPIIARVPLGGEVKDPFFFKVEIGGENLAANGHKIPGIEKMIASGYSTGIREQSCARGYIDSVTFIFVDGRIVTHGKATGNGKSDNNGEKIGYLADRWGKPCIRGKYINNAKDYLLSRGGAAFIEAAAQGLSQSQVSVKQNSNGETQAILDGNVWQYIFGQGVGGAAGEVAEYVRERVSGAFDVVYVEQAMPVQIFLDQMLPIDYDSNGRKINYYEEPDY